MKVSSATIVGIVVGIATGIVSLGQVVAFSPQIVNLIQRDAWWIVVFSLLVPLYDYLTGVRTTMLGVVTRHPYRHVAGFFAGLAFGLGLFILISPKLAGALLSVGRGGA
jgi:hypothetical protein